MGQELGDSLSLKEIEAELSNLAQDSIFTEVRFGSLSSFIAVSGRLKFDGDKYLVEGCTVESDKISLLATGEKLNGRTTRGYIQ